MSTNYPNVLKPIKIGSMTVKNRINMAPHDDVVRRIGR